MSLGNRINPFKELKNYVASWQHEKLAFCYDLACSVTPAGLVLTLQQQQIQFSLSITLQPSLDCLRLTTFSLTEESNLGDLCQPLYDAALIEIVLQGLDLIAFCAQRFHKHEVNFMLSPYEAEHLTSLEGLFQSISSHTTTQGKRQLLSLFIAEELFEVLADLKTQLHQKLWTQQKTDLFIRRYWQSVDRLNAPVLSFLSLQKKQAQQNETGNVISFLKASQRRSAI
ncbi:MAG: hypothetical protein K0M45_06070 [Candidatus Paracaedibacteraceae bacterium]|nr:hypothetical protein [Candidatus Paracaedibacteraceae bacterium]